MCMYLNPMVYKMIVLLRSYHQRCRTTHHGYLRVTAEPPQYQLQANTKLPLSHLRTTSEPPHTYLRSIAELPQNHRRTTSEHKRATDEPRGRATSKPPLELLFSLNSVVMWIIKQLYQVDLCCCCCCLYNSLCHPLLILSFTLSSSVL